MKIKKNFKKKEQIFLILEKAFKKEVKKKFPLLALITQKKVLVSGKFI